MIYCVHTCGDCPFFQHPDEFGHTASCHAPVQGNPTGEKDMPADCPLHNGALRVNMEDFQAKADAAGRSVVCEMCLFLQIKDKVRCSISTPRFRFVGDEKTHCPSWCPLPRERFVIRKA